MNAIDIGTLVWSGYSGLLRVGTVVSKRIAENGWAYFTIEWHDDGKYESVQNYYRSMNPNREYGLKEYKASFVHPVTPEQLEKFDYNDMKGKTFYTSSGSSAVDNIKIKMDSLGYTEGTDYNILLYTYN